MRLLALAVAVPLAAQAPALGTVDFPTSATGAAQQAFTEGVLLLHSFEYDRAAAAFRRAQQADPRFAMAYWGEAMTYNHPLWNQWDDAAARGVLARAPDAPTARERLYLEAVRALWADGPKPQRDTAYHQVMARLVDAFPDDDEARAFYALSILGLSGATRNVPTYMRAAAVAQEVFQRHPNHPGAAHYIIHSFDDPTHAPLGLPAARVYSRIAPDAAHAQHMTTHIFLAMGMWDDVVSQNQIAAGLTGWGPGHYTSWLLYGQTQQGRADEARAQLVRARDEMGTGRAGQRGALAMMRAHYVINTERWDDPVLAWDLPLQDAGIMNRAVDAFVQGYAAERRNDLAAARARLDVLRGLAIGNERIGVLAKVLEAAIARRAGDLTTAIRLLEEAGAVEDAVPAEYGPPDIVKPSHELLGEVLLAAGRRDEAHAAFRHALQLAPGRLLSRRGLER